MPGQTGLYQVRPPIMTVKVEDVMDIMIVRDTARRAAALLGFTPAHRAQLSTAAAALAELMLKSGEAHTIQLNGAVHGTREGLQISSQAPFLVGVSANNVLVALRTKLGELVDEIHLENQPDQPPTIIMVMWLTPSTSENNATAIHKPLDEP